MTLLEDVVRQSRQRDWEKFLRWLQQGGQALPSQNDFLARSRLRNLYDFCQWVGHHDAYLIEAMPFGLVAADGPDERRWEPVGGLRIEDWPYLKSCCGREGDEVAESYRDEIMSAILVRKIESNSYSYSVATSAVAKMAHQAEVLGIEPFWKVIEALGFDAVVEALNCEFAEIANRVREPKSTALCQLGLSPAAVLTANCGIAQGCAACKSVVMIPVELARKWKVILPEPPKKRGARQRYDPAEDRKLYDRWKSSRRTRKDFARNNGYTLNDLRKAIERVRKRRKTPD
jgi:hypothetical protein